MVICDYYSYDDLIDIAEACREHNIGIILGDQYSVYGRVVVDLGENFLVYDKDGEPSQELKVESISVEGVVELTKGSKHTLQDGDVVQFKEVV